MMKNRYVPAWLAVFALAACLLLVSCGGGAGAATMHLVKTRGTVGVSDGDGRDIELMDDLGLYSGYQVGTETESYAWINLDDVKLTKMDAESEVEIAKDGGKLEINVKSGSLFFNVTEPLTDDETMDIRTSSMAVGIRGTCGWVTEDTVALLEGTVTVTAGGESVTVNAGEMAVLTEEGGLEVKPFPSHAIPAFVQEEVAEDEDLVAAILDATGMDLTEAIPEAAGTDVSREGPLAPYADALSELAEKGEILYTEELDFEADGSPELLVLFMADKSNPDKGADRAAVSFYVYRSGPDGSPLKIMSVGCCLYNFSVESEDIEKQVNGRLSLVESEGRLFLKHSFSTYYSNSNNMWEQENYYGSIGGQGGFEQEWGFVEEIETYYRDSAVFQYARGSKTNGFVENSLNDISAEEFVAIQNSYKEVKVLVYTPDNASVVVTPDPSEIEESPQSSEPAATGGEP